MLKQKLQMEQFDSHTHSHTRSRGRHLELKWSFRQTRVEEIRRGKLSNSEHIEIFSATCLTPNYQTSLTPTISIIPLPIYSKGIVLFWPCFDAHINKYQRYNSLCDFVVPFIEESLLLLFLFCPSYMIMIYTIY